MTLLRKMTLAATLLTLSSAAAAQTAPPATHVTMAGWYATQFQGIPFDAHINLHYKELPNGKVVGNGFVFAPALGLAAHYDVTRLAVVGNIAVPVLTCTSGVAGPIFSQLIGTNDLTGWGLSQAFLDGGTGGPNATPDLVADGFGLYPPGFDPDVALARSPPVYLDWFANGNTIPFTQGGINIH